MWLRVSRLLLYVTLFALLLGGGFVHGLVTDRWALAVDGEAARLDLLPATIEDWDGSPIEANLELLPQIQSGIMVLRRYVNRVNGATVTLFLTVGRAGPLVAAHHPDSCYPGAGYQFASPMVKRSIPVGPEGRPQEFRVATFSKTERASPVHLRVYWSWTATGDWRMPDNPRLTFAGQRRLYKLYVIRQLARSGEPLDGDAAESFIQTLTPEFKKVFFADR